MTTPNAIYIGNEPGKITPYLERISPEWNFVQPYDSLVTFVNDFQEGKVDHNIQVVIIHDALFDPHGGRAHFENLIAQMSPYGLVLVLSYYPQYRELIQDQVEHSAHIHGLEVGKFYFIDKKTPRPDIRRAVDDFVLTHIPENGGYTAAILAGRDPEPVNEEVPSEELAPVDMNKQRTSFDFPAGNTLGQVVTVTSSKGGSGKSTVAATLATYIAHASVNSVKEGLEEKPLKVCILDLDIRDGQIGFLVGKAKPTVMQIKQFGISVDSVEKFRHYIPNLKLDVLLAPRRPRSAEHLTPDFYAELIQLLRTMYDYVILDTSVNYTDPLLEKVAYPIADQIVMVTEVVQTTMFSMARWVKEVTSPVEQNGMGIPKGKIGIVVNKALDDVSITIEDIETNAQNVPLITAIPSSQRMIAHATNVNSIETLLEHTKLRASFRRLATAIVGNKYRMSTTVP